MIKLFNLSQSREWDSVVRSFSEYDVYYLSGYVRPFQVHGDGDPYLVYYEGEDLKAIYVYFRRPTAIDGVFDSITPYGYGGVLFEGNVSPEGKSLFWNEYLDLMKREHIVDNFVRYHPVLGNALPMKDISPVIDLGKTIALDLSSEEIIWDNIASKNRNMIRKAEKNGITIHQGKGLSLLMDFKDIYNSTMDGVQADPYYYFGDAFYDALDKSLNDNYTVFYAVYEEKIIAMSIMLFANKQMHYHLSGSLHEFRNMAPSNLLLYKAALWGCSQGYRTFHLGGGVGSGEDSLFKFKQAFNRNSDYQFSIGKQIFDKEQYDRLVELRRESAEGFDENSSFFPLYRSKKI